MLRDAIEYISNNATAARRANIVTVPSWPKDVAALVKPDGTVERLLAPEPPFRGTLCGLDDVVDYIAFARERFETSPVVWVGADSVVVQSDQETARDAMVCPLEMDSGFKYLLTPRQLDQDAMVDLLRLDLAGAVPTETNLLGRVRAVKWRSTESGHGEISSGRESMGREIEREVVGDGQTFPDEVVLSIPVYRNVDGARNRHSVPCAFVVKPAARSFALRPIGGAAEAALRYSLAGIVSSLRNHPKMVGVPVMRGYVDALVDN